MSWGNNSQEEWAGGESRGSIPVKGGSVPSAAHLRAAGCKHKLEHSPKNGPFLTAHPCLGLGTCRQQEVLGQQAQRVLCFPNGNFCFNKLDLWTKTQASDRYSLCHAPSCYCSGFVLPSARHSAAGSRRRARVESPWELWGDLGPGHECQEPQLLTHSHWLRKACGANLTWRGGEGSAHRACAPHQGLPCLTLPSFSNCC